MKSDRHLFRNDAILTAAVVMICAAAYLVLAFSPGKRGHTARVERVEVYRDGMYVTSFPLDRDCDVPVIDGTFTLSVRDGRVTVLETDCSDRICASMSVTEDGGEIICVPNRIVVRPKKANISAKSTESADAVDVTVG